MFLKSMEITKKAFFAKGHRSLVYAGFLGKKKIAIKEARKDVAVKLHIANEGKWLKVLNKYKIGPRLLGCSKNWIVYEFVSGEQFVDWIKYAKKEDTKKIIKKILLQLWKLDKLGVNKEEMHRPLKHIFVKGNKVTMIDFERCHKAKKPKNVSQFCGFLLRLGLFKGKEKRIKTTVKKYKTEYSKEKFKKLIKII